MNIGAIRKMIEGMDDNAPIALFMVSAPQDDVNVVIEDICPSKDKDCLHIHVSVVPDCDIDDYNNEIIHMWDDSPV